MLLLKWWTSLEVQVCEGGQCVCVCVCVGGYMLVCVCLSVGSVLISLYVQPSVLVDLCVIDVSTCMSLL